MSKNELNFEEAFSELELILEKMNAGKLSLDESLHSYEKADALISRCRFLLKNAEKKVEILVKKRGEEDEESEGTIRTESFRPSGEERSND